MDRFINFIMINPTWHVIMFAQAGDLKYWKYGFDIEPFAGM